MPGDDDPVEALEQARAQRGDELPAALLAQARGLAQHHDRAELLLAAGKRHDRRVEHPRMLAQPLLELGQRDALALDLGHPVEPPLEIEAAVGEQLGRVAHREPVAVGQVRRAQAQGAFAVELDGHTGKRRPGGAVHPFALLAPGDPAGLGAAVHLDRRRAEPAPELERSGGGQGAARGENGAGRRPQRFERDQLRQACEVRGARDDDRFAGAREPLVQQRRVGAQRRVEGPPGAERPYQAKQQAVDVMMRDGGHGSRAADRLAPARFQDVRFGLELRERFLDALRRAARPRGEQINARRMRRERREIERGGRQGGEVDLAKRGFSDDCVEGRSQLLDHAGLEPRRDYRALSGVQHRKQRGGEVERLLAMDQPALRARSAALSVMLRNRARDGAGEVREVAPREVAIAVRADARALEAACREQPGQRNERRRHSSYTACIMRRRTARSPANRVPIRM